MRSSLFSYLGVLVLLGGGACEASAGNRWVQSPLETELLPPKAPAPYSRDMRTRTLSVGAAEPEEIEPEEPSIAPQGHSLGVFRNTYYTFPEARYYTGTPTALFDSQCHPIASVAQSFHDTLCVQGSGRLAESKTVAFATRDCPCAALCPRTGQRICYQVLDAKSYPWGRGALGLPINPFRTVAVDPSEIALGSALLIPSYVGLKLPDGTVHDGCFRAEDRGIKIVGKAIDIFLGPESSLPLWNKAVPSGAGVEVFIDQSQCGGPAPSP